MFIFQVYLPCVNLPIGSYRQYIDKLYDIWHMYSASGTVLFLGDFNAQIDPSSPRTRDLLVCKLLNDTNLIAVNTLPICKGATFSFVSYDNRYTTLIDFICAPADFLYCVRACEILDDNCLNVSRHRPVLLSIELPHIQLSDVAEASYQHINWRKATDQNINLYKNLLGSDRSLNSLVHCTDIREQTIDQAYDLISKTVIECATKSYPKKKFVRYLKTLLVSRTYQCQQIYETLKMAMVLRWTST